MCLVGVDPISKLRVIIAYKQSVCPFLIISLSMIAIELIPSHSLFCLAKENKLSPLKRMF